MRPRATRILLAALPPIALALAPNAFAPNTFAPNTFAPNAFAQAAHGPDAPRQDAPAQNAPPQNAPPQNAPPQNAHTTDRPLLAPTRDVDVVYMMVQEDAPGGPRVLEERMRWAAATGKLRIDPPTPGMWVLMDTRTHTVSTVRESEHSVLEIAAALTGPLPSPSAAATFQRRTTDTVAGVPCTEWQTTDVTGAPTLACITADGVLLRARSRRLVLLEAMHVAYAPQDAAVFQVPADYRRMTPPPLKRPPP